jgi:hypothetical protein
MKLIKTLIIPEFITKIKLSDSRRAKYYLQQDKLPKKYQDKSKYEFRKVKTTKSFEYRLFSIVADAPVIKNSKVKDKARFKIIKGNDFYSGLNHILRTKIIEAIKEDIITKIELFKVDDEDYPLYIEFIYCDVILNSQDLDNKRYAYEKATQDLFTTSKVIIDDKVIYINKISSEFVQVDCENQRTLIINLYKNETLTFDDLCNKHTIIKKQC